MHISLRRAYLLGALFVLLLTALFAAANVHWLRANTVTYGWDRLDHLISSFVYRDILGSLTPQSVLAALAYSDYYPPLVHWGSVVLYGIFGVSEDVAPLVNVFYTAILLGATFWIAANWHARGARFGGAEIDAEIDAESAAEAEPSAPKRVPLRGGAPGALAAGALAAAMVGLFPILFAMSRYLYLDFALTALVALCMALLLASKRFGRRWPSLGFGLALGLAFLVKWTAAAFVVGPLLYLLLRSGALPLAWRQPRALLPHWGKLFASLAAGLGLIALWFALAQDVVAGLRLGQWLALPLGLLLGGVVYSLLPSRPAVPGAGPIALPAPNLAAGPSPANPQTLHNVLGAGVIAAFIIALWYLTNLEFLDYFLFTAYGREDQPFYAFGKYAGEVFNEQMGPWFSLVFVAVTLVWAFQAIGRWRRAHTMAPEHGHVGVPADPHVGVRATQNGGVRAAQNGGVRAAQIGGVRAAQIGGVRDTQIGDVREAQVGDVRDTQVGDVRDTQNGGVRAAHVGGAVRWVDRLSDTAWVLLLWVIVPYLIFSFRVTLAHSRFLMPFLPPFAIWMAVGLMGWRPRWVAAGAISTVLLVGVAQFALLSFDELAPWRAPLRVQAGGQSLNLLANGFFIQYPTSGVTDPGYGVAPEVLSYVEQQRKPGGSIAGKEVANLGLLVNSYQVHEKHFLYSIYKDFPQVRLRELARNWSEQAAYNQLFDMDFVLVSDTHTFRTNENSQAAAQRILFDPADGFNQAFAPLRQWTLPSGEQLTLYGRRFESLAPGVAPADYQQLLTLFGDRLGPGDAVVLVSPDQVYMLGLALPADAGATIAPLPMPGADASATPARLRALAAEHARIFLVSHNADQVDADGSIEGWLRQNLAAANDLWAGGVRVTPFVARTADAGAPLAGAAWQGGVQLAAAQAPASATAGGALVVETAWDVPGETGGATGGEDVGQVARPTGLRASLQLFGPDGALAAQEDRDMAEGAQEFVLLIPRSAPPGDYRLGVVLYDPATGERFVTAGGQELAELGAVTIAGAPAPAPSELPPLRHPDDAEDEGS